MSSFAVFLISTCVDFGMSVFEDSCLVQGRFLNDRAVGLLRNITIVPIIELTRTDNSCVEMLLVITLAVAKDSSYVRFLI